MTRPKTPLQKQDQLLHDNDQAINKDILIHFDDPTLHETDKGIALNNSNMFSPSSNYTANPSPKTADHTSENRKLSAIQSGNTCVVPKHLKILNFCSDHNKIFAVCHTRNIPGHSKKVFSLYIFDLTSGLLEKVIPLWDNDNNMCSTRLCSKCVFSSRTLVHTFHQFFRRRKLHIST